MPTTEPLPRRSLKVETGSLRKFGDNVRARREAQDLSSPSTLSLSNGQEQLAERADLYDIVALTQIMRGTEKLDV